MAEKIRQYLINGSILMPAYDLNEALIQYHIKYKGIEVAEIMPVTIEKETVNADNKIGEKKPVHVKPTLYGSNPKVK